jgi:hypothetical protein
MFHPPTPKSGFLLTTHPAASQGHPLAAGWFQEYAFSIALQAHLSGYQRVRMIWATPSALFRSFLFNCMLRALFHMPGINTDHIEGTGRSSCTSQGAIGPVSKPITAPHAQAISWRRSGFRIHGLAFGVNRREVRTSETDALIRHRCSPETI